MHIPKRKRKTENREQFILVPVCIVCSSFCPTGGTTPADPQASGTADPQSFTGMSRGSVLWWYQHHRLIQTGETNRNFPACVQKFGRLEITSCFYNSENQYSEISAAVNEQSLVFSLLRAYTLLNTV